MASTISSIKQQVKRPDRYSIYIDGKYVLSLHESTLLKTGLRKGQELTSEALTQLTAEAVVDKGYERALNLISHRLRSEWEVRDYLRRKDYSPDIIDVIVERLYRRKYLNDEVFAKRWVDNRRRLKATSYLRLKQELRQKRLSDDVIELALTEDETSETDVLRELIDRKRQATKYQDDQKLIQYLVRQGFGYGDIKAAMSDD